MPRVWPGSECPSPTIVCDRQPAGDGVPVPDLFTLNDIERTVAPTGAGMAAFGKAMREDQSK